MTAQPQTLDDLAGEGLGLFRPPPEILPSQWADQTRRLSSESSAEPGAWDTSRAEYQRGMMDAVAEAEAAKVVFVTGAQLGKSEILLNVLAFHIATDPGPMPRLRLEKFRQTLR